MKFLGQGFQQWQHYSQTDVTKCITMTHLWLVKIRSAPDSTIIIVHIESLTDMNWILNIVQMLVRVTNYCTQHIHIRHVVHI